jgi:hypothetical protein
MSISVACREAITPEAWTAEQLDFGIGDTFVSVAAPSELHLTRCRRMTASRAAKESGIETEL